MIYRFVSNKSLLKVVSLDAQSKAVHILHNISLMLYMLDLEKFTKKCRRIQNCDKIFKTDEKKKSGN